MPGDSGSLLDHTMVVWANDWAKATPSRATIFLPARWQGGLAIRNGHVAGLIPFRIQPLRNLLLVARCRPPLESLASARSAQADPEPGLNSKTRPVSLVSPDNSFARSIAD